MGVEFTYQRTIKTFIKQQSHEETLSTFPRLMNDNECTQTVVIIYDKILTGKVKLTNTRSYKYLKLYFKSDVKHRRKETR